MPSLVEDRPVADGVTVAFHPEGPAPAVDAVDRTGRHDDPVLHGPAAGTDHEVPLVGVPGRGVDTTGRPADRFDVVADEVVSGGAIVGLPGGPVHEFVVSSV